MRNLSRAATYLHEIASSVNIAFALVATLWTAGPRIVQQSLFRLDVDIATRLGLLGRVAASDYADGYFALFIPATSLSVLVWALLRVSAEASITREFLRSAAGFTAIAAAPLWRLSLPYIRSGANGWSPLDRIALIEVGVVLAIAGCYAFQKWPRSARTMVTLIVLHYAFWFSQFETHRWLYSGMIGPSTGACASLAWIFFICQTMKTEMEGVPAPSRAVPQ